MSPARSLQARSRITCPRRLSYVVHVAIHIVLNEIYAYKYHDPDAHELSGAPWRAYMTD